ncbi:MAG: AAA family ATPase [Flavobacteriaceae bacterium]
MKTSLHKLQINNFKAFRGFSLNLEGRHLLVYGANGSGKSSLYWALYTFFQSARKKPQGHISKYFDASKTECLLNIHEQAETTPLPGKIELTFRDAQTRIDTTYPISETDHRTFQRPEILKADLASDFITYRFFFGFSHFRNSEKFNLWPLFEKEILPFCVSTSTQAQTPLDWWLRIKNGKPNPSGSRGRGGTNAYARFTTKVNQFAGILPGIVDSISNKAQEFYDEHFAEDDPAPVTLKLKVTTPPSATGSNQADFMFTIPEIEFGIQVGGHTIQRPQSYLNEGKLTQFALSVRFAASLVNLHDSDIKLLVLDDLLVSLDMNNRMKVVEILLSESFSEYQKIILTHDKGFFEEVRRIIAENHAEWCFRSLRGNPKDGIEIVDEKRPLEKAVAHIYGHDLEAAASQLRKAAEETAKKYRRVALGEIPSPGEFHSLTEDLKAAKNHLLQQLPVKLYNQALKGIPITHREKLVSSTDEDIDNDTSLTAEEQGRIKCQRRRLKRFLSDESWKSLETVQVIDRVIRMKDRVLNPASHWNEAPLYQAEVLKALKLIERLEKVLH